MFELYNLCICGLFSDRFSLLFAFFPSSSSNSVLFCCSISYRIFRLFVFLSKDIWFDLSVYREICCCCILLLLFHCPFCSGKSVSAYSLLFVYMHFVFLLYSISVCRSSFVICMRTVIVLQYISFFFPCERKVIRNIRWNKTSSSNSFGVRFLKLVNVK